MPFVSFLKGEGPDIPEDTDEAVALELRESMADKGEHLVVFRTANGATFKMPYRAFKVLAKQANDKAQEWLSVGRQSKITACSTCSRYTTTYQRPDGTYRCRKCW